MNILSFLGIILGLVAFIVLSFKGFNLLFNAVVCVSIMILMSGMNYMDAMTGVYMAGVSGFLKNYLLLFVLSCLYGKVMEDSGAVRKLALMLSHATKKSKKNQKFLTVLILPAFYMILGYVGISGFVVVFTVVALARELFEECDIPWKYYCYGAGANIANGVLAGNAQAHNINACKIFGVDLSAGAVLSIIYVIVNLATLALLIYMDVKKSEKNKEGFLPTGKGIKEVQLAKPRPEEELPNGFLSVLPLLVTILCIVVLKLDVLYALSIAIILCFVSLHKYIPNMKQTLGTGIAATMGPVVNVAAAAGMASVIAGVPGFAVISTSLDKLPDLFAGVGLMMVVTLFVANPVPVFTAEALQNMMVQKFAGLSNDTAVRLALGAQITPCPPWNAGVVNAVALTKLKFSEAAKYYFKGSFFPGLAALIVMLILIGTGIFA